MKKTLFPLAAVLACVSALAAPVAPAAKPSAETPARVAPGASAPSRSLTPAESDYEAFVQLRRTPPGQLSKLGRQGLHHQVDQLQQQIIATGLAFIEKYPAEPLRWRVVDSIAVLNPPFVKSYGPRFKTDAKDFVVDEKAKAAWQTRRAALLEALDRATDVPREVREKIAWDQLSRDAVAAAQGQKAGASLNWLGLQGRFYTHLGTYADLEQMMIARADDFLALGEKVTPGSSAGEWERLLAASPSYALRVHAARKLNRQPPPPPTAPAALAASPGSQPAASAAQAPAAPKPAAPPKKLEIVFIAVDGRPVDLAALHGKVVLVQFWGTWSAAWQTELPVMKKVYDTYHAKGFEIVGISVEDAKVAAGDTPTQAADKLADAKKAFQAYLAREGIAWPQFYDGKGAQNEFVKKFGVKAVPANLLLDQEGVARVRVGAANLEAEVRKLLKL